MASENENDNRETVADIVAEMRREVGDGTDIYCGQRIIRYMGASRVRLYCDRIEAAWKRDEERAVEHATRHAEAVARDNCRDCVHNPNGKNYEPMTDCHEIGNAAAMRDALTEIRDTMMNGGFDGRSPAHFVNICDAALSAPARNCDLYKNKKDAEVAFISEECKHPCGNCTVNDEYGCAHVHECGVDWLFAPAKKKGEGK